MCVCLPCVPIPRFPCSNGPGGRVYDAQGRTPCLWDGCCRGPANPLSASSNIKGVWTVGWNLGNVRIHEAQHTKGEAPKGFLCPEEGCDFAHPTSAAAVWAHMASEHGVEADEGRCLWDGCEFGRKKPSDYLAHEPTHTGVWPHHCAACGKGHGRSGEHWRRSVQHACLPPKCLTRTCVRAPSPGDEQTTRRSAARRTLRASAAPPSRA